MTNTRIIKLSQNIAGHHDIIMFVTSVRSGPDLDRVVGEARRQCLLPGGRAVADLRREKNLNIRENIE